MPELPDITLYLAHLQPRIEGQALEKVRLLSPFLLRSVNPPLRDAEGKRVVGLRRLGKRIVIGLERKLFLVLHLMIAGRLQWRDKGAKIPGRSGLAAFDFSSGTLLLTEAGRKRRAASSASPPTGGLLPWPRSGRRGAACVAPPRQFHGSQVPG